ncbi:MAG: MgtC/SapB family protein [Clostridia bacterium]|nr:MgtC/SapB family protein [Clostridia bacterium]
MNIVTEQIVFIFRIFLASVCGCVIGYERKNRGKGAGIRTHAIVALASALMMIVSKYGFADLANYPTAHSADPARIAAQVVSGVGFLGAGMIYFNRHLVKGLTTAAGIWATAGVGLAIGAGLYVIGIVATGLLVLTQVILHKNYKFLHMPSEEVMTATIADSEEAMDFLNNMLEKYNISVGGMKCRKKEDGYIEVEMDVSIDADIDYNAILKTFKDAPYVSSIII